MGPDFFIDYGADEGSGNVILPCKRFLSSCVRGIRIPNFRDFLIGKLRSPITFPRSSKSNASVIDVISMSSQIEMFRINACRIVALVKNEIASFYGASMDFPGESVRSALGSIYMDLAVTFDILTFCPEPAPWSNFNRLKESITDRPFSIFLVTAKAMLLALFFCWCLAGRAYSIVLEIAWELRGFGFCILSAHGKLILSRAIPRTVIAVAGFLIPIILANQCLAAGPKYSYEDPKLDDEMANVYHDIRSVLSGDVRLSSVTITSVTVSEISGPWRGTTTNDSAAAGFVGQQIESTTASNSNASATTVFDDLLSIELTPGDWNVTGIARFNNSAATWSQTILAITTISGNDGTGILNGNNGDINQFAGSATTPLSYVSVIPPFRVSVAANTTYYLKRQFVFSAGTPISQNARITARRVR